MHIKTYCSALLVGAAVTLIAAAPAQAVPMPGQGTWDSLNPNMGLKARDLNGDGFIDAFYDPELNITWLRDANVNGAMDWTRANAWANAYSIGSYSNWRLPTMVDTFTSPALAADGCNFSAAGGTDCGFNVQTATSEMAHLWYITLGNKSWCDPATAVLWRCNSIQSGWGLTNAGDFQNMPVGDYWSGTEYAPLADYAWGFDNDFGIQLVTPVDVQYYVMAVRDGDVAGAQVPEPTTLWLALGGLAGLGVARRRWRRPV